MSVKIISFLKIKVGTTNAVIDALKKIPEISKIQTITGEYDLIIELIAEETEILADLFSKRIDIIPGIREIHSHYVMRTWEK